MANDRRSRRRSAIIVLAFAAALGLALEGPRLLQLTYDLEIARSALIEVVTVADQAGAAVTVQDVASIGEDMARADASLVRALGVLDDDPLLEVVRAIPSIATQLDSATRIASAARRLTSEHLVVAGLMERYVAMRDSSSGAGRIAEMSTFAVDERASIDAVLVAIEEASVEISELPDEDLIGPLAAARADVRKYLDRFVPLIGRVRPMLGAVPSLFGVGTPRRYLVLALDNAELRPVGGLIVAYATLSITDGRFGDLDFRDIATVDRPDQITYVPPPVPLQDHLLGDFTWQVADAGWWPDFARSADEARRLYAIQTGDSHFDGVIAFTPDFVDALIGVLGPVEVPGTGIAVRPGETYVRSLEEAEIRNTGPTRKRFLTELASAVLGRLEHMPADRLPDMIAALAGSVDRRQIQILPDDAAARDAMIEIGAYTPFAFEDGADRLAIMGANVAPVSKLHALLDINHDFEVVLHSDGSADEHLTTTYVNHFGPDLPTELVGVAKSFVFGNLGTYERRYLAPNAELLSVRSSGPGRTVTDPESLELESGCLTVGNYLFLPPGATKLETLYRTPGVVTRASPTGSERVYRLVYRKQPGRDRDTLTLRITLPVGARLIESSDGASAVAGAITFHVSTDVDRDFLVRFSQP